MFSANHSLTPRPIAAPRTPTRGMGGSTHNTPQGTPTRTRTTPHRRYNTTPHRSSAPSGPIIKPPKVPDFVALAREQQRQQQQPANNNKRHNSFFAYNPEKEPIKSYLRIRPHSATFQLDSIVPYLHIVDDLEISMTPPEDSNAYRTRNTAPERYKFTKIFTDTVSQQEFFNKTTLPLIHDVLHGENALIFAYGVTNSGKTFSIMGTKQNPGILPRTLDVIFNSIEDYKSETQLRPCMHSLVQQYSDPADENRDLLHDTNDPMLQQDESVWGETGLPVNQDKTAIAIDEHYEYGIWVSFAEIYTEKIYDLLIPPDRLKKRKALSLKYEYSSGHKYIAGLKEVKVKSIQEAYQILFEGQRNRAEYSTITNHTSSRSHSIFTIRIVRAPIVENEFVLDDPVYATVSKFSIVDLAGSERYRNTLNSGQRLKEAGNINKSLMVLGQCMETLRLNQMKNAIGKKAVMVPYRHSKLTELFKSSFEGDGKAVMVVNVNPFDTGFDENSHVMKFAAVAKDVATWRRVHPKLELSGDVSHLSKKRRRNKVYHGIDALMNDDDDDQEGQPEGMDLDKIDIDLEEEEEEEEEEDDDGTEDPFVDNLISQLDELRNKWIEAETRCATIESQVRQQVAKETETELKRMEDIYMSFLKKENDQTNAQIQDLIQSQGSDQDLLKLQDKQTQLSTEMDKLCIHLNEQEATKHGLLKKIAGLEKDAQKQKDELYQLHSLVKEKEDRIQALMSRPEAAIPVPQQHKTPIKDDQPVQQPSTETTAADPHPENEHTAKPKKQQVFEEFLDLRKKLRRSIFRGEEYSHDADVIMGDIERFPHVTFDLVKETNMGKLMKLITQRKFTNDPYNILNRSRTLFKQYAQLSLPILAPKKTGRESMIVLSVNAGREEELITEMRHALSTLQDENGKLKQKLKLMQEGHRRLKEAFEKATRRQSNIHKAVLPTQRASTSEAVHADAEQPSSDQEEEDNKTQLELEEELLLTTPPSTMADPELEMFSPILGATVPQSDTNEQDLNGEDDDDLTGILPPPSPLKNKKRRKLRSM